MAGTKEPAGGSTRRVETALKAVMEAELSRLKVAGSGIDPGVMWFSSGIIFSKSGNGTPFSKGIIFSKVGAGIDRPEETGVIETMISMDEPAFNAFADRLIKMKNTQIAGQVKEEH